MGRTDPEPPAPACVEELARRLLALPAGTPRRVIGICGPPGAGKSTVTDHLMPRLRAAPPAGLGESAVAHLPMDGFHLADVQLARRGLRDRKGAPETFDVDGYVAALIRLVEDPDTTLYAPGFERDLEQPIAAAVAIEPGARLVITEGNYLLLDTGGWERVRPLLTEAWYVDLDPAVRRERLVARHVRFGKPVGEARTWVDRNDEANARIVEATRGHADLIVEVTSAES
ncbi:MAG: nucleoside/nucleotide kinase family protein [Nocardioides sp.]